MFKTSKQWLAKHNIQAHKKLKNLVLLRQMQMERKHNKEQYDRSFNKQSYKKACDILDF